LHDEIVVTERTKSWSEEKTKSWSEEKTKSWSEEKTKSWSEEKTKSWSEEKSHRTNMQYLFGFEDGSLKYAERPLLPENRCSRFGQVAVNVLWKY
jgi:hypothetical protein